MSNSYFTSDWHFGHERSLRFEARKGFSTHKEIEDLILANMLDILKPGDNLYFAGDLGWKLTHESLNSIFDLFKKKRINFHWILGNHDKVPADYRHKAVVSISHIKDIVVKSVPVTICHYPMICWNKSHNGAIQVYGHIHQNDSTYQKMNILKLNYSLRQVNVNIELNNWKPWSFEEIVEKVKNIDNWDKI